MARFASWWRANRGHSVPLVIKKSSKARRRVAAGVLSLLAVAAVLAITVLAEASTQQVVPASAAPDRFSAQRAIAELERFATAPRPLGSEASDRTMA